MILASTFAALAGLVAAHRAFHRQLELNELKSNFVSSVSHELRAPIASVRLMAENLEGGKIPGAGESRRNISVSSCRNAAGSPRSSKMCSTSPASSRAANNMNLNPPISALSRRPL